MKWPILTLLCLPFIERTVLCSLDNSPLINHVLGYYRNVRSLADSAKYEASEHLAEKEVLPPHLQQQEQISEIPKLYSSSDFLAEKKILPPHILTEEEERNSGFPQLYSARDHLAAKQVLPPHLREGRPYASFEPIFEDSEPEVIKRDTSEDRLSHYGRVLN